MAFANPFCNQDINIPVGQYVEDEGGRSSVGYNPSLFLRTIGPAHLVERANMFTVQLDNIVHVSSSDLRYMRIYSGIDTILGRLMSEMAIMDSILKYARIHPTGSIASNVKVGLPHEADYVCELPQAYDYSFLRGGSDQLGKEREMLKRFCEMAVWVINQKRSDLTKDLDHFKIHGAKSHKTVKGVCLYMQCQSNELFHSLVGITVDLVFVFVLQGTYSPLTSSAASFLPCGLQTYAQRGMLHRLMGNPQCDTGLIENEIVAGLPKGKQRGFRVAKFMLQNYTLRPTGNASSDVTGSDLQLDPPTRLGLYGYKPAVSSYKLRVLLLHLLQHIRGRPEENMLNDGVLAICLLDMLRHCGNKSKYVFHPFIADMPSHNLQFGIINNIEKLISYFFERHPQEFTLMNHEHSLRVFTT